MWMYHLSPGIVALPNKRVQSDAAAAAGYRAKNGYVTHFELKPISEKSRRG
jgi:hypothetical protein